MTAGQKPEAVQVALVAQHLVAETGYAAYIHWLARLVEDLRTRPGFIAHEVIPPAPPGQIHWVTIMRFETAAAAQDWLAGPERERAVADIQPLFLKEESIHLLEDAGPAPQAGVSAFIAYDVPPEEQDAFLKWQKVIYAEETRHPGFLRHKIERPVPGMRDQWIIVLTFDSDANLTRWLDSPERQKLLADGGRLNVESRVSRASYGFDFWFQKKDAPAASGWAILKNNLLVLLVLYPIVYLWGLYVGPLFDAAHVPFWLGLFVANLASTQILGWWAVPAIFRVFDWWLAPDPGPRREALGLALIAALYALSMALYAGLAAM
ncbi:antibiotic biosynthesis monooxygenase [Aquabacter spiritensis]|uniref:ABM domain-containing protein n=1 Tax=Aquabacter spiritensis TaxID=933073 RepID=A0A4R3LU71_9HYPH|nr:antibiotic biosynthesis monooxygenase [Aquabacter spiritensis]TCT03149.1 hypothetical protein EDC64_11012 [Aquabacter spiritensis]